MKDILQAEVDKVFRNFELTGKYLSCVERSVMNFNDVEYVSHDKDVDPLKLVSPYSQFDNPHVLFTRPLTKMEMVNPDSDETKRLVHVLHAVARFARHIVIGKWRATKLKRDYSLSMDIGHIIGSTYYDCMSGGMPQMEIALVHYINKRFGLDMSEKVYPRVGSDDEEDWVTIKEFLDDTKKVAENRLLQLEALPQLALI